MTKRIRLSVVAAMSVAAASLSAHVIVSPTLSKSGAVQKYEVRVHNEAKVAATSIEVDIPDGVTVVDIAKSPNGTATTKKAGDRVTGIIWKIDVQPNKYVALPFTAKNPDGVAELHWTLHEHLADGSTVSWSDKAGSKEKGSVTKLTSAVQPPASVATDQQTFAGTITDDMCANADHSAMQMGPTAEACTKACVEEHGAAYVLFDGTNAYTLLSDQRLPERFAGTKVRVTGMLDAKTKTIRVNSIRSAQ